VEIWHADQSGAYIHQASAGYANRDRNFQGFGRFLTGSTGEYFFRTIKAGLYPGRTRHIHFKVKVAGMQDLTSQLYFLDEPQNSSDGILNGIRNMQQRNSVIVPFVPVEGSTFSALAARFDIVLSNIPGSMPLAMIVNTTNVARNPGFQAGDSWRLDVQDASAGSHVYLHLWKDNTDLGRSGPYGNPTDATGAWTLSGGFGAADVGVWQLQAVIGSAASQETSAPVSIRIANT
jgi:hypothetical protein